MGMPQVDHVWTPDRVRALPDDGRRYEVVAGELLVTPAPSFRHQDAVFRLTRMRWRPGDDRPEVITEVLRWHPDRATAPLEIDLPRLFATVNGD
jgi:hypothetical protein